MTITHVVLDLDNTLIHAVTASEDVSPCQYARIQHLERANMENYYTIYERPGLQDFLTDIFKKYKVSVFTAASKNYALFVINKFILRPGRVLEFIFFSYHCNLSQAKYNGNHKRLAMLCDDFQLGTMFPLDSTVLIDDLEEWAQDQPENVINCKPFNINDVNCEKDTELNRIRQVLALRSD